MANERALELFKDESFLKELGEAATAEEAQKLFEAKGGEITVEELKAIRAMAKQQAGEKLDGDELDLVAGGASAVDEAKDIVIDYLKTAGQILIDKLPW